MSEMRIVGLDLSLQGNAAVSIDGTGRPRRILFWTPTKGDVKRLDGTVLDGVAVRALHSEEASPKDQLATWRREVRLANELLAFVAHEAPLHTALEDHAFGAQGQSVYQLARLHALVRYGLNDGGLSYSGPSLPFRLYSPSQIKKWATGTGTATKEAMAVYADRAGFHTTDFGKASNNLADAYWIAQLQLAEMLVRIGRMKLSAYPKYRQDVLTADGELGRLLDLPYVTLDDAT